MLRLPIANAIVIVRSPHDLFPLRHRSGEHLRCTLVLKRNPVYWHNLCRPVFREHFR